MINQQNVIEKLNHVTFSSNSDVKMPKDLKLLCNTCRQTTWHVVLQIIESVKDDGQIVRWKILQCGGCDDISFWGTRLLEEDIEQQVERP